MLLYEHLINVVSDVETAFVILLTMDWYKYGGPSFPGNSHIQIDFKMSKQLEWPNTASVSCTMSTMVTFIL